MLQHKIVAVTGASSGIGALIAQRLSAEGAYVILIGRSEERLQEVSKRMPGPHEIAMMDVRDDEQVQAIFKAALAKHGKIDVLINNAGYGKFSPFLDMSLTEFEDMMNVNYLGVVRCTQAVLRSMLEQGDGQIVNVASMAGKIGTAKSTAYSATKHALLGFSNSLRQELHRTGITISTVNPGPIDTPFLEIADPSGGYMKNLGALMLKPDDVARRVVTLVLKRKEELNLPRLAAFGIKLYQLCPRFLDRALHRWMNKK
ncbi:SDR family oxidoreductase [Paenibacillus sp. 7541]|uniref:SDR family NAD(P)-dependent oxidoreductase n=1 Tax=Paenibacillus sp. 7541 TaxID=2026236 RepID=UPI000BA5E726|nr:SDR family oxidoreductase [Paenibacillus sp. 7541]PAK52942.1 oxidoreductase [Paenibacillus sp. 7541]